MSQALFQPPGGRASPGGKGGFRSLSLRPASRHRTGGGAWPGLGADPRFGPGSGLRLGLWLGSRPRPGFRRGLGRWLGLLGALVPAAALACPSCTARAPESPGGAGELLLALMLVPFVLVGVGLWAARRAGREERASAPVEQEHL